MTTNKSPKVTKKLSKAQVSLLVCASKDSGLHIGNMYRRTTDSLINRGLLLETLPGKFIATMQGIDTLVLMGVNVPEDDAPIEDFNKAIRDFYSK